MDLVSFTTIMLAFHADSFIGESATSTLIEYHTALPNIFEQISFIMQAVRLSLIGSITYSLSHRYMISRYLLVLSVSQPARLLIQSPAAGSV